jgi:hypothetical protein
MTKPENSSCSDQPFFDQRGQVTRRGLRQISGIFQVMLLGLLLSGCMSIEGRQAEQIPRSSTGPWIVMEHSVAPLGHRYEFGPFATTGIGLLQGKEIRNAEAPNTHTVKFARERATFAYELRHSDGTVARVRLGRAEMPQKQSFLQRLKGEDIFFAGSVEVHGQLLGEFAIRHLVPLEQPEAGFVHTSAGEVTVVRRREPVPQSESAVAAFFQPDHEIKEHYMLDENIVATRRYQPREIWIDPRLPGDVQLCIAAAMTVPLTLEATDRTASQGSLLSTSARLAPSG